MKWTYYSWYSKDIIAQLKYYMFLQRLQEQMAELLAQLESMKNQQSQVGDNQGSRIGNHLKKYHYISFYTNPFNLKKKF